MLRKVLYIVGGLFVTAVFVVAVGLGVWANKLNTQLTQVQADNVALQSDYDALGVEYAQAQADFKAQSEQAQADLTAKNDELTAAQAQITALEAGLKKSQDENAKLNAQIAEIQSKVEILNVFWFSSQSTFERKVAASGDKQLQDLWAKFEKDPNNKTVIALMDYMIESIAEACGVY